MNANKWVFLLLSFLAAASVAAIAIGACGDDDDDNDDGVYIRSVCWVECAGWKAEDEHTFSCLISSYDSQEECNEGADEFVCGDREVIRARWEDDCCPDTDDEGCEACNPDCVPDWFTPDWFVE